MTLASLLALAMGLERYQGARQLAAGACAGQATTRHAHRPGELSPGDGGRVVRCADRLRDLGGLELKELILH